MYDIFKYALNTLKRVHHLCHISRKVVLFQLCYSKIQGGRADRMTGFGPPLYCSKFQLDRGVAEDALSREGKRSLRDTLPQSPLQPEVIKCIDITNSNMSIIVCA